MSNRGHRAFTALEMIENKAQLNVVAVPGLPQRRKSMFHPGDLVTHAECSYTYCLHTIDHFNKRGTGGSFAAKCDDLDPKAVVAVIAEFIAKPRYNSNWWYSRGVRWVLAIWNNSVYWIPREVLRIDARL